MNKYVVYVNDSNHKYDSVSYEIDFPSIREAVKYVHSLPSVHCCGHIEKWTYDKDGYISDVIMRF